MQVKALSCSFTRYTESPPLTLEPDDKTLGAVTDDLIFGDQVHRKDERHSELARHHLNFLR